MPDHADHHHEHHHHGSSRRSLGWSLVVVLGFAVVEGLSGWWAGSLALLGDAGHMVSDATALGVALLAAWIARRPPSARHSYGLVRAEAVAALANGLLMLLLVAGIVVTAVQRLQTPQPVQGEVVLAVAAVGLLVNIVVLFILSGGEETLNTRAALLHVMGDLLGSIAALLAGAVIYFTGWTPIDPILSLVICALILFSCLRLLRDVLHVLMEGVPHHLELPDVGFAMAGVGGVRSVHDLHIWTLATGRVALSAHVQIDRMEDWPAALGRLTTLLHDQYDIDHITLQPEPPAPNVVALGERPGRR